MEDEISARELKLDAAKKITSEAEVLVINTLKSAKTNLINLSSD